MFFQRRKSSMEYEIFEQSKILEHILNVYVTEDEKINIDVPEGIKHVVFVASGSSYHCARYGADIFGSIANIEARAIYSSEFLLKAVIPYSEDMLYVFITQSGETSDTNKALIKAKQSEVRTLCVTNKEDSTIWNASDYKVCCHAGVERSIAATKSLTSQMMCITLLALKFAQMQGIDTENTMDEVLSVPRFVEETFKLQPRIKQVGRFLSKYKNIIVTADGISYALAKEAALKIKETSYLNVASSILGEFMHGHVAVMNNKSALIYILVDDLSYTATKNLNKIKKDYNPPICIMGNKNVKINSTFNINIDCESKIVKYFCVAVMIQLLALEIALKLRRNVDKPHGLDKVVK
ncbi:MAG: SIS domain-containing protein [Cyanobacteria bacterium SIG32]|nr:SIS domain-containing protein [Cyanobacteria bacterium SIG32]